MNRVLWFLPLIGGGLVPAFWQVRDRQSDLFGNPSGSSESRSMVDSGVDGLSRSEGHRTKSKERPDRQKPTIQETIQLLRSTILPVVEFPEDQTVAEGVAFLNEIIRKEGVDSHRLRVIVPPTDPVRDLRIRELKLREVPVVFVLKALCGSSKLRYRVVEDGVVELASQFDLEEETSSSESPESEGDLKPDPDHIDNVPGGRMEDDPFAPAGVAG